MSACESLGQIMTWKGEDVCRRYIKGGLVQARLMQAKPIESKAQHLMGVTKKSVPAGPGTRSLANSEDIG